MKAALALKKKLLQLDTMLDENRCNLDSVSIEYTLQEGDTKIARTYLVEDRYLVNIMLCEEQKIVRSQLARQLTVAHEALALQYRNDLDYLEKFRASLPWLTTVQSQTEASAEPVRRIQRNEEAGNAGTGS
jgi:hypothetical protein